MPQKDIDIILKDGKVIRGNTWKTNGLDIAKKISRKLADSALAIKVKYHNKEPGPFSTSKNISNNKFS